MRKLSKKAKRLIIDFSSAAADLTNKAIRPNFIQFGEARAALMDYIAELEAENGRLQESWLWETVCPDGSLRPKVSELLLNLDGWKERSNGWESIVETLNTRIAVLEEAQRWIPVSERLPEKQKLTIGFTDNSAYVFFEIVNDDEMGLVMYPYQNRKGNVTHWMPLPEPPEVQE